MFPRIETDNPISAVFEACDLAADGRTADGYQALFLGKRKALEGDANFEPWAEEPEGRWEATLERYAARYGLGRV